ncbi:hypothetical protein ACNKHP_23060 [Shigella boydii]
MAKGSSGHHRRHRESGDLMNWKAGALSHLTENGNVCINSAVSGGLRRRRLALRSLAAVTVPTAPILNRKKPTPARLAPNGRSG